MTIVDLHDQKCILMNSRLNFYKDHLSIGDFNKLFEIEFPLAVPNLPFIEKFRMMVEVKPEIEVWTVLNFYHYTKKIQYRSFKFSVSTSGRVWDHLRNKERKPRTDYDGYLFGSYSKHHFTTHRIVLSSFGHDIPTELEKVDLTVNHINKKRNINNLLNLEWMTMTENVQDGTPKSSPLKFEVVENRIGIEVGTIFYLPSRSYLRKLGINPRKFKERYRFCKTYYGLKIETVNDFIPTPVPQEFIDYFLKMIPV